MSSENKLTAIQDVVLKMQEAKENFPQFGFDEEFIRGFNKAFQMAIFIAEKVGIEKEKQQIIDAFNDASLEKMGIIYYETKFKN